MTSPAPRPPVPVLVARWIVLVQAAALAATGVVLALGAVRGGGLADMAALGGFFVVLGAALGVAGWRLGTGSRVVRGFLVTVQLLVGASLLALPGVFGIPLVIGGVAACLIALGCLLAPATRAFTTR